MESKEKYEKLLEEQLQSLKNELNNYKIILDTANVLSMPRDNIKEYVYNLLEQQKLILHFFPELSSNLQIINFFLNNNALEIEQVTIALNNILKNDKVKECIDKKEEYKSQIKRIEHTITDLNENSLSTKVSFILKTNITDEEKISILKDLAYESCMKGTFKEEKKEEKEPLIEPEILFPIENEEEKEKITNLKASYSKVKEEIDSLISKNYYLIDGKTSKDLNYIKQMDQIIKKQKEKQSTESPYLDIKDFEYKNITMTILLIDMLEAKQELETLFKKPNASLEDIEFYFNELKEQYSKAQQVDTTLTEDIKEEEKETDDIYFLLDENNNPFFQLDKFNKEDKKRCKSLIEKFEKSIHDYEKGKHHTKLQSRRNLFDIYVNKSSNMCVSYIRAKDNQVLVITFAHLNDIFDESNSIAQNYDNLIESTLSNIENKNTNFINHQQEFFEQFKTNVEVKGDEHR